METLLICLLLAYNAYLVFYLLREKKQGIKQQENEATPPVKPTEEVEDIVGKSLFKMELKTPLAHKQTPQAAIPVGSEDITDIDITFADETDNPTPARLPDDKLDEAFTHIQISDVALAYEENETEDEDPTTGFATGVSFEEIGEAMIVVNSPASTEDESHRAGQVFTELEGNELFNQLIKSSSIRSNKITELMDYFLSNSISRDGDTAGEVVQLQSTTEIPTDISGFDIRDFV
jgi:hypothetical protein